MVKYRHVNEWDEYDSYQCLGCKHNFYHIGQFDLVFCPHCGVKWDGEFTKRHRRYHVPEVYDTSGHHIVVEVGNVLSQALSSHGFFAVPIEPKLQYSLYSHTYINGMVHPDTTISPVILVYRAFEKLCKQPNKYYDYARLSVRYKNGRVRIIKEVKLQ
jgi:hypothetical protein